MATQENNDDRIALLQGTLDLLMVDHGSLYVALQRLEDKKWISAKWGLSENNRKARFYSLTAKGREQLVEKIGEWRRLTRAMGLILEPGSGLQINGLQGEEA
jgi:PadR family transcriptional regulator PadR